MLKKWGGYPPLFPFSGRKFIFSLQTGHILFHVAEDARSADAFHANYAIFHIIYSRIF